VAALSGYPESAINRKGTYHDAWVVVGLIIDLKVVRVEGTIIVSYMNY
jgi:hypothetical protein